MSSDSRISAKVAGTVAGITILGGFLAYAVYFDYKRRNDVEFRKQLRKQKKKVEKRVAETHSQESQGSKAVSIEELKAALARIRTEPVPASPEAREQYFMSQVGMGETLCMQGPSLHMTAALCFFRALRVYPSPVELIAIYQKTVPEPVFNIVMELMNLDVSDGDDVPEHPSAAAAAAAAAPTPVADDVETSPVRGSPPSETSSSQEWDRVSDSGEKTPA